MPANQQQLAKEKKRKGKQRQKAGASSTSFAIRRASHSQSDIRNLQLLVRRLSRENPAGISRENPAGISKAGPESFPCIKLGGKTDLTSKKTGGVSRGCGAWAEDAASGYHTPPTPLPPVLWGTQGVFFALKTVTKISSNAAGTRVRGPIFGYIQTQLSRTRARARSLSLCLSVWLSIFVLRAEFSSIYIFFSYICTGMHRSNGVASLCWASSVGEFSLF